MRYYSERRSDCRLDYAGRHLPDCLGAVVGQEVAMIVVGIDPGPKESAYVVWDGKNILQHANLLNDGMLDTMYPLHHEFIPCLWVETMQSYGTIMGGATIDTLIWIGRFIEGWKRKTGELPKLAFRPKIKAHICGNAAAKDSHVREALIDRIGPQGKKHSPGPTYGISGHIWSALAVAVYGYDKETTPK
jgi:hypothetical protein